jgi:5-methylcytosine-specific restriction endonuclease McrA
VGYFSASTRMMARIRQRGRCAVCGDGLDNIEEFAHHLDPRSLGGAGSVDNCAIVCRDCHYIVHAHGRYRTRIVAARNYFPYLRGRLLKGVADVVT